MGKSRQQNQRKNIFLIIGIILIIIITLSLLFAHKKSFPDNFGLIIKNNSYFLETAQTNQQRKIGLSNRDKLCSNCGMFFVFDKEGEHGFWMKNTHVSLDIIWLNSQKQIVKIIVAAPIDSETTYINKTPAKYAIELPANESLKLDLKIGDAIDFTLP